MNPLEILLLARKMATGSPLLVEKPDFSPRCATDAEFDALVTAYYKLLYEELSRDVAFLKSGRKMPRVKKHRDSYTFFGQQHSIPATRMS